jgi:NAD(P)-dependent dehydrogenase (short-subunit alcohol dehydrogenase family)
MVSKREKAIIHKHVLNLTLGRVHIVTGGYAGCGFELSKILYQHNATVYIAGRSTDKANKAIAAIKEAVPNSKGKVEFLKLDLSDLSSIKPAAEDFMSRESRLDVLTNNAGVMVPAKGSKDAHGHELQLGTNCLGPFLLSESLLPILQTTAKDAPADSVRVTWAASLAVQFAPTGGVQFDKQGHPTQFYFSNGQDYAQSKTGNVYLASEFGRRYGKDGIVSVSWNPGNLKTELQRTTPLYQQILLKILLFPAVFGAYTELYAGYSPAITASQNGAYVAPWGRIQNVRKDVAIGMKSEKEGGTGIAERFWAWCEQETKKYA